MNKSGEETIKGLDLTGGHASMEYAEHSRPYKGYQRRRWSSALCPAGGMFFSCRSLSTSNVPV